MAREDRYAAQRRRHHGVSRVGTVTGTVTAVAAGLTVAVAGGLALGHASASPATTTGGAGSTVGGAVPGDDGFSRDPGPSSDGGGLLPAQSPPQVQSHGS